MPPSRIPTFYSFFFTTIDPLIALSGVLTILFAPKTYLESFVPHPVSPIPIETTVCLDIMASFFLGTMILQIFLLRARPADLIVWRTVQAYILVTDFGILGGSARALLQQDRLGVTTVRLQEWGQFVVVGAVAVIRVAFLLGLGVPADGVAKRE